MRSVAGLGLAVEGTAALIESIARLAEAEQQHQVKRVEYGTGRGWAETLVCTCGEWVLPDEDYGTHILAELRGEEAEA